jgi:hypothetical protein
MPEGLSPREVSKEISEHRAHAEQEKVALTDFSPRYLEQLAGYARS